VSDVIFPSEGCFPGFCPFSLIKCESRNDGEGGKIFNVRVCKGKANEREREKHTDEVTMTSDDIRVNATRLKFPTFLTLEQRSEAV